MPRHVPRLELVEVSDGSFAVMDGRKEIGRLGYLPREKRWFWSLRWTELTGYERTRVWALHSLTKAYAARS